MSFPPSGVRLEETLPAADGRASVPSRLGQVAYGSRVAIHEGPSGREAQRTPTSSARDYQHFW